MRAAHEGALLLRVVSCERVTEAGRVFVCSMRTVLLPDGFAFVACRSNGKVTLRDIQIRFISWGGSSCKRLERHSLCYSLEVFDGASFTSFLGAFAKVRKATTSFLMCVRPSICPSACNSLALIGRIFMKFDFWLFFENLSRKFRFNPLNAKLNPICHLLALLGAHHILHVSRIRVN